MAARDNAAPNAVTGISQTVLVVAKRTLDRYLACGRTGPSTDYGLPRIVSRLTAISAQLCFSGYRIGKHRRTLPGIARENAEWFKRLHPVCRGIVFA